MQAAGFHVHFQSVCFVFKSCAQQASFTSCKPATWLVVVRRQCILGGGSYDLLCLQTQHSDVQQRIADLEADIASKQQIIDAQLQAQQVGSCPRCAAMAPVFREVLGQRSLRPSRYSQCWRATGDFNEVRSNAFASLVTHSGGSSRKVGCVVLYVLLFSSVFPLIR